MLAITMIENREENGYGRVQTAGSEGINGGPLANVASTVKGNMRYK